MEKFQIQSENIPDNFCDIVLNSANIYLGYWIKPKNRIGIL